MLVSAALAFTSCGTTDDTSDGSGDENQQVTSVGVRLSAPGLVSGIDPAHVSGIEVDLAATLAQRLGVIDRPDDITWVRADASSAAEELDDGEMELLIGQFDQSELSEDIAWVGPYATVEAGLLVRNESPEDTDETDDYIATETVASLTDVHTSSVCVVAGSLADGAELPAAEVTTQQTVTECETGMRSGRYDAIAADDLQLAGVLADAPLPTSYDLLLWSELADDDTDLDEQLLASGEYWLGTTAEQCESASAALAELIEEGEVEELFGQRDETTSFQPQLIEADEVTTKYCDE